MGRAKQAAPMLLPYFMNIPALRDEHVNTPGFYFGALMEDTVKPWRGFALYESSSDSSGFIRRGEFANRLIAGAVNSIPLGAAIDYRMTDYASTITVTLVHPSYELESVTESEMRAGRNRFLVGTEIIGIATWKHLSSDYEGRKTYQGSIMLRGIKDTFANMDLHLENEPIVWLDGPGIYFFPHAASRIGESTYFKVVAGGGTLVEASPYSITLAGETIKPFRPVSVAATRNGGNDIIITWERQPRKSMQLMQQGAPHEEELERYKIRVLQSAGSSVAVRETLVLVSEGGTRTWTYSSSNQTTDGKTPGAANLPIEILQMSSQVQDSGHSSILTV